MVMSKRKGHVATIRQCGFISLCIIACLIHVVFVNSLRNSTCTPVFNWSSVSLHPYPLPFLLHLWTLHGIFAVTLPSPLPAGCCDCWHAPWHMPGSGAKHRASLQLEPRLSVVLVPVQETFCPLLFPVFTSLSLSLPPLWITCPGLT